MQKNYLKVISQKYSWANTQKLKKEFPNSHKMEPKCPKSVQRFVRLHVFLLLVPIKEFHKGSVKIV